MPVTPNDVRVYLPPQATTALSDDLLESFIGAWQTRADLATGGISSDENSAVFEAVRLGAASSGLTSILRSVPGQEEPGQIKALREQAEALIKTLDELTIGPQEDDVSGEDPVGTVDGTLVDAPVYEVVIRDTGAPWR